MAHNMAKGMPQLEAYKAAGFTGQAKTSANAVAMRPEVKARVQEIIATQHKVEIRSTERAIERAGIDKEYYFTRLKYVIDRAVRGTKPVYGANGEVANWLPSAGDNAAAINGLELVARTNGWLIQKHEVGAPGDFARLSDKELEGELIEVGKAIGLSDKELLRITSGSEK
jgi:hypothetical protein